MSKLRKICAVSVDYGLYKAMWVTIHWEGEINLKNGHPIRNYHSSDPKRIARLLKHGRKMQDILLRCDGIT